jgi:hypothetical protein
MSKKRHFILKNINSDNNIDNINAKYGLVIISNISKEVKEETNTTKITDIISLESDHSVSFLDENKKETKCITTMVEYLNMNRLPEKTDIHCFWCRHSFTTRPIGCPIKFVNSCIEKSYVSQITKDKYYMKENLTKNKLKKINLNELEIEVTPIENDYFLTDGNFCSFNCVLAFIKDNNHNNFYRESYSLLHTLYESFVNKKMNKIIPAPHWRLLKSYGGNMNIEEYRNSFNTIDYEFIFNIRDMKTISKVYREKNI